MNKVITRSTPGADSPRLESLESCNPEVKQSWMPFPKQLGSRIASKLPLRLILVVPFVAQVFAAVGLVGYVSFKNGQAAIDHLASQLMQEVGDRVDQQLDNYLTLPHQINQINISAIEQGMLDIYNFPETGRYFWKQMQALDLTYIFYALETGEFVGAGQWLKDQAVTIDEKSAQTDWLDNNYATDSEGNRTELITRYEYNPLIEPWYTETVKAGQPIWSQVYNWDGTPEFVSISATQPIYNQDDQLIGVLGADFLLSSISDFLAQLTISPSARVFIVERDGRIIASSSAEQPFKLVNGTAERLNALDSQDPSIHRTAQFLQEQFSSFQGIDREQSLTFVWEGQRQFVQVIPWQDEFGLDWLVVVTVPEQDFMGQIQTNARMTLLLCLLALAVTSLLGLYTSRWVARPIQQLQQASQAIATGNLEHTVTVKGVHELESLGRSFNQMATQLRHSFTALAQANETLEQRVQARTLELKTTLDELQRTQFQLIQTEKMSSLGQLVAGIAHEINNPVCFIHGNLAYLNEYTQDLLKVIGIYRQQSISLPPAMEDELQTVDLEFVTDDLAKILYSMKVGSDRICEIIASLKNFSRLDEADYKAVDIHEGIENTLLILRHRLKASPSRPEIQVIKEYGVLPTVECYPGSLNQVFMNLLSNAIDALEDSRTNGLSEPFDDEKNPRRIWIQTQKVNSHWVRVAIANNGPSIPKGIRSRLFDPFFTTKPVGKGTGLGLSISYQIIVTKHNGKLVCDSTDQRTTFVIEIPVHQIAADAA